VVNRRSQGQQAENTACAFLQQHGLTLIEKNYRCRSGEIDLVMRDGRQLVFVEVRYRRSLTYGGPIESIDYRKRLKLIATARHYLVARKVRSATRFDVVGISADKQVRWIPNAVETEN
jgi:putative endonuclease